jgi:hypothetical protein
MTVADRYEGQEAGACGCGSLLVWTMGADGQWHVAHADPEAELACSAMTDTPSDVDEVAV